MEGTGYDQKEKSMCNHISFGKGNKIIQSV